MVLSNRYSGLERRDLRHIEERFHIYSKEKASANSLENFRVIQRSDQKLWLFRTGILVWSDETSGTSRCDSTCTPRKTASGNSCKILREIQQSDQTLWPFRTGFLVSGDDTSASRSSDSTSKPLKMASGNSCKILREMQRSDQNLWVCERVL